MKISIHRHQFSLQCPQQDEERMRRAAAVVEQQLETAKTQFNAADSERAAVIAALLIAFRAEKGDNSGASPSGGGKAEAETLRQIHQQIDDVLQRTDFPAEAQ